MKLLSWNSRSLGIGNPCEIRSLRELLQREDPDLVFLQETKVRAPYFSFRKLNLGFRNGFVVNCVGKSGGLVLLWKEDLNFEILNFSLNLIHGVLQLDVGGSLKCFITKVYGPPKV